MKDQVIMSLNNGALCIAIPLYRFHHEESLGKLDGYIISITKDKPLVYAIDIGEGSIRVFNAEWENASKHM